MLLIDEDVGNSPATSSPKATMSKSINQTVDDVIASNKIVVFSKSYCPYCKKAKNVFTTDFSHLKDKTHILELDQSSDGPAIQKYLLEKTGQGTVPNIFINKKHVGGCDDLLSLKDQDKLAGLVGV